MQQAMDLSGQLGRSVPAFTELARAFERAASEEEWAGLDALHRHVVGPLTLNESPVRIIIDAIDQLPEDSSAPVRAALPALADIGVRIVLAARPGAWLPERTEQLRLRAADDAAVGAYLEDRGIGGTLRAGHYAEADAVEIPELNLTGVGYLGSAHAALPSGLFLRLAHRLRRDAAAWPWRLRSAA
jgi:hypothetical protein